ncbi:MAG: hypothetical protein FJ027_23410 [Candidatus Rokubacteria bacterium]|nr:hypothetical protein [Candidatus Rokubacteria bacterium]
MSDQADGRDRHQDETSQAARTPVARHEDALSPGRVVREHSGADGEGASQRIGNTGVQGPTVSFPGEHGQASTDGAEPTPPATGTDRGRDER